MNQVLELVFELADGKSLTLSVPSPKAGLTAAEVNSAMQAIVAANAFSREGAVIAARKSARIVEREVTEFDMN
ncbi:DUF2922 domain-containing protein [Lysinibacillus odysseyi]|uniref:DUF2922 domain-containing protein n=1 Tax=Lysinibacillus odysseyi 34hs-1 = NBRC 100172 TaxID=1220589 RepID=A0A0A3J542_9BACI|nr:DUF2922 domain-containing protein [Lysinibacillus odysseyi]KGR82197.1 hypothetical protein CD32_23245 [Lysinibacillus odysseyi 34hs-1 = NBRC 100172]